MAKTNKRGALVFLVVLLAGAALHFCYQLLPIAPVALFAPVDESLFQHLKLLFWPVVIGAFFLKRTEGQLMAPRMLGLLCSSVLMLCVGWLYHITFGGERMLFDIALYVVLMALAFVVFPRLFPGPCTGKFWSGVCYLTIVLGVLIVLFTFWPPNHLLFTDLSGANTWTILPC